MNICSKHHDEVAFEGHDCPMCETIEKNDREIAEMRREIDNLKDGCANNSAEAARLQAIIDEPLILAAEKVSNQL